MDNTNIISSLYITCFTELETLSCLQKAPVWITSARKVLQINLVKPSFCASIKWPFNVLKIVVSNKIQNDFWLAPHWQRYWQNRETANIGLVSSVGRVPARQSGGRNFSLFIQNISKNVSSQFPLWFITWKSKTVSSNNEIIYLASLFVAFCFTKLSRTDI